MTSKKKKSSRSPAGRKPTTKKESGAQKAKPAPATTSSTLRQARALKPHPSTKTVETQSSLVEYDKNLLERARTQWQFGDWESLAQLQRDTLQHHPDRAKLALLAAAGRLQTNNHDLDNARQYICLAQEWGCSKELISQILIAGVYNSLDRIAALAGRQGKAMYHFEKAVAIRTPGSADRLATRRRIEEQFNQLGISNAETSIGETHGKDFGDQSATQKFKDEIKRDIQNDLKANNSNPYGHNRTLTPALNKTLREFASNNLKRDGIKVAYIDYLAAKAIQVERNCVGRLATTVQDAVVRQLVAECISDEHLCILEIGALYGVSLAILYNHAITRFQQVQVVCLDPLDGYYGKSNDAVLNQPINDLTFLRNMRLADVPQEDYLMVKYYSTDPVAISSVRELPINVLIIDGDHSYEGVKFDFDNYFPLLQLGGYVIFDDHNSKEWPGVQKFVDEDLRRTPGLELVGAISRTAVVRKTSDL